MKTTHLLLLPGTMFLCGALILGPSVSQSAPELSTAAPADDKPVGIQERVLWTTSRVKGTPEPPAPYRTEAAFPKLKFDEPLAMTRAPGTDRLFVTERYGKVYSFPNSPQVAKADLLVDLNEVLGRTEPKTLAAYGFALHPRFEQNGSFFITYVTTTTEELPKGTRLSRFRAKANDPLVADPGSEQIILEWPSGGHNGGCLQFGPDGYLYVATGDSSGIADEYLTGQDLSKLPGAILRIDVDREERGKPYAIPPDNPFVGVEGARPEIWAYGLRQPWKMSFDRATGDLWTGNVGQDLWEMLFIIEKGGNYGWSVTEGSHPFRPDRKQGPTPILQPIVEHSHADFRSITGGFVYHGNRLEELRGAYIYGDYDTGRIWALRYDRESKQVTENSELVDSSLRLVGFAEDQAGELYLVDHMGGGIHRLAPNPAADNSSEFPRKLSDTGLFTSTKELTPAPGLIPYSVIAPSWSDGARKEWYLAMPGESQIEYEAMEFPQPAPGAVPGWKFPNGTVIVETISLEMEKGNPASRRRIETRILHNERLTGTEEVGDQYWRGYTYLWDDAQSDAALLDDTQGLDRTYTIADADAPGGQRQQTWHFPSRAECTVCHNMAAKYVLGVNTLELNKDHDYGGVVANQLRTFEHLGLFTKPLPAPPEELPRLVDYREEANDLDRRARAYLHANCSFCHRKWGGGNAEFQFLYTLDLPETGTVGTRPGQGAFFIPHAEVLAAGDPYRSVALYRMAKLGPGRMPRIGSGVVDEQGVRLLHDWLAQLPNETADRATSESLARARAEVTEAIEALRGGGPAQERTKNLDRLLATTSGALRLLQAVDDESLPDPLRQETIAKATHDAEPHVRDLFERFLPEEQRTKRLGSVVRPEEILALPGDAARGKQVFLKAAGVQCRTCHQIEGQGTEVGPDLSEIGKKYDRAQLLETILEPSKVIEEKYRVQLVETVQGRVYTGLLVEKTRDAIVLKGAENKLTRVAAKDVDRMTPQQQSLMPDLLLREMTAQQVADLIAYLSSLK